MNLISISDKESVSVTNFMTDTCFAETFKNGPFPSGEWHCAKMQQLLNQIQTHVALYLKMLAEVGNTENYALVPASRLHV